MRGNHTAAVFWKQIRDTTKNKAILIQFVLFPVMTVMMENMVRIDGMPERFFVNMFAPMYAGMAPIICMASVIAEEKEKNTLRVLLMSRVKPWEYLLGTGGAVWLAGMAGAGVIGLCGRYTGAAAGRFLLLMAAGILVSILIGAAIGVWSRNQIMETSITVPVMMVFSFLPMLATFNPTIAQAARLTYSGQIHRLIDKAGQGAAPECAVVMLLNAAVAAGVFLWGYQKGGME